MTDAARIRLATKLQRELAELQALEAAATESGDEATAQGLRERIAILEAQMSMLSERVDAMATQSWAFDIKRNDEGFMTQVIASPHP
jgi:hypothetical protein